MAGVVSFGTSYTCPRKFSWPGESIHSPAEIATLLERIGIDLKA